MKKEHTKQHYHTSLVLHRSKVLRIVARANTCHSPLVVVGQVVVVVVRLLSQISLGSYPVRQISLGS